MRDVLCSQPESLRMSWLVIGASTVRCQEIFNIGNPQPASNLNEYQTSIASLLTTCALVDACQLLHLTVVNALCVAITSPVFSSFEGLLIVLDSCICPSRCCSQSDFRPLGRSSVEVLNSGDTKGCNRFNFATQSSL